MSPEEWAFKIGELIKEAEADTGFEFATLDNEMFILQKWDSTLKEYVNIPIDL